MVKDNQKEQCNSPQTPKQTAEDSKEEPQPTEAPDNTIEQPPQAIQPVCCGCESRKVSLLLIEQLQQDYFVLRLRCESCGMLFFIPLFEVIDKPIQQKDRGRFLNYLG